MVSKQLLEELRVILEEEFGLVLEQQDLSEFGNMLVQLFEVLQVGDKEIYYSSKMKVQL